MELARLLPVPLAAHCSPQIVTPGAGGPWGDVRGLFRGKEELVEVANFIQVQPSDCKILL